MSGEKGGRVAYEAYCDSTNNKSLFSGWDLPPWQELKMEVRIAWVCAALAVIEEMRV